MITTKISMMITFADSFDKIALNQIYNIDYQKIQRIASKVYNTNSLE
jgi:hypothetical protein